MGLRGRESITSRFMEYVEGLVEVIGHADRAGPLRVCILKTLST